MSQKDLPAQNQESGTVRLDPEDRKLLRQTIKTVDQASSDNVAHRQQVLNELARQGLSLKAMSGKVEGLETKIKDLDATFRAKVTHGNGQPGLLQQMATTSTKVGTMVDRLDRLEDRLDGSGVRPLPVLTVDPSTPEPSAPETIKRKAWDYLPGTPRTATILSVVLLLLVCAWLGIDIQDLKGFLL